MLLGGLILGSLTACSSSDDEPETKKASSARTEYTISVSQDLLNAATVMIYYINDKGAKTQETMTQTTWKKTVNTTTLPTKVGFYVHPQLKGEPTGEEYDIDVTGQMTFTVLDQNNATFDTPFVGEKLEVKGVLGAEYLGQYLTRISNRVQQAKSIAADGKVSESTIDWGGNADGEDQNINTGISDEGASGTTRTAM